MLENIKLNEKYTLIIENTMGFIVSRQVKIIKAEKQKEVYSFDKENLIIHYVAKNKRKVEGWKYSADQRIAIIEGWHEVKGTIQDKNLNSFESFNAEDFENILKINNLIPAYEQ